MKRAPLLALALLAGCSEPPTAMRPAPTDVPVAVDDYPPYDVPPRIIVEQVRPTNVDATLTERAPARFDALTVPSDAMSLTPWMGVEGDGLLVAQDGRFFSVDSYAAVTPVERMPDEPRAMGESPVAAVIERAPGEPIATVPAGGLAYHGGFVRRAELPMILSQARARAPWGPETLWATPTGVYMTSGDAWLRLDRGGAAVTDVVAFASGPADAHVRDAWALRASGELLRLRVEPTATSALQVTWSDPVPGITWTGVRATASLGAVRYAGRADDLVRVTATGAFERLRIPGVYAGPDALVTSGRWLWMAWSGMTDSMVARTDGSTVEVLARGVGWERPRLAVDGDTALVTDGARAWSLVVSSRPRVAGFADGESVARSQLALRVYPPLPSAVAAVEFRMDGQSLGRVTAAPYGWGDGGAATRDFPTLGFGEHAVTVLVSYRGAPDIQFTRRFTYLSPIGRVPTYTADILPLYNARCARCHSTGIARDLRGYERISDQAPLVAQAVGARRMPPDLAIDAPTIQLVTAWVAGGAPR